MMDFAAIFGTVHHESILQACARAAVIFIYGLVLIRLSGRRTFGKWSALDIIVSIIVGSSLSRAITGTAPMLDAMAATAVVLAIHWALARLAALFQPLSWLLEGQSVELLQAGNLRHKTLVKFGVTRVDVAEALHRKGLRKPTEATSIVLEPGGTINPMS